MWQRKTFVHKQPTNSQHEHAHADAHRGLVTFIEFMLGRLADHEQYHRRASVKGKLAQTTCSRETTQHRPTLSTKSIPRLVFFTGTQKQLLYKKGQDTTYGNSEKQKASTVQGLNGT